jgi:hypothetical protein
MTATQVKPQIPDEEHRDFLSLGASTMTTTRTPDAISADTWGVYRRAVRRDLGEDVYELAAERRRSAGRVVTFPARAVLGIDD